MIEFDQTIFTQIEEQALTLTWKQPIIDDQTMLPILSYRVYWDAGYLLEGNFVLLTEINAFDHFFYRVDSLVAGHRYQF